MDEGAAPYAHGEGDWVGFDNIASIEYKVDMAKYYGLGGIMWWAIDIDDFKGEYCGQGKPALTTSTQKTSTFFDFIIGKKEPLNRSLPTDQRIA